ncbi:M1 family metallopeptidase [Anabaena sp. FACHB-1237]|uniref:M1 family metallopeptidase n=1 Tax=Anabaena sp. FACHB-1237 TaxID=2692769 RepID=UPI001681680F|nr:M1 family metallopeptidase [Anabaena sp. FACHB-1237]MBD2139470.1 M1 family metallopeptidase [Anabaena sp. FACHB-1237]
MSQFYFDIEKNGNQRFELPGAKPHYNPDRPGQVEHIFLDICLDITEHRCYGSCNINLSPIRNGIDRLVLDAVNLHIESVKVDDIEQKFDYDGKQLCIYLSDLTKVGKNLLLAIAYAAENPERGIYFITPDAHYPHKPTQVWTQGEDEDSRFWFPCFDYPGQLSTSEIRVRVPKPLIAVSNGELINTIYDKTHITYHWLQQQVHPTYLITLAVSDFAVITDHWEGKPVTYYVEKGREADAKRTMGKTPQMIAYLSEKYGYPYPYPKYAQVCVDDFIFGGMENTSTTLLTDRCLLDEKAALDNRNTESLVVHELAHQWFGDLIVIKHWSHAWIKEGMASYSEVMWTEKEYGNQAAAYYRLNDARNYISEDSGRYRRPMVTHVYRAAIELYDRHTYEKGSCIYHLIRAELGDDLFWQAIQTFVRDNAHKTVETIDLLRAIEKATGRNLTFLFDQYVYRGGHPDFKLGYSWDNDANLAKVTVTQTQVKKDNQDIFDLKIPIGFGYKHNPTLTTFTVRIHEKEQSFYFPLAQKPDFISFDVGNHYLKTVNLEYPVTELKAQLEFDPDPISRIYAAEALAKKGGLEAVKALTSALKHDEFWGVRVEVAKQLADIKLDQAVDGLWTGLEDASPFVRRAVINALTQVKTHASYKAVKKFVQDGDTSYYVESAACYAIGAIAAGNLTDKPHEEKVIKLLKSVLEERAGWNEVVRSGAIAGLAEFKTSEVALEIILQYTKAGVPQPLRLAAIRALGKISTGQTPLQIEKVLNRLKELCGETFFLTQVAVLTALGRMETPKAIAILQSLGNQSTDGRVKRYVEEEIAKVQKNIGADKSVRQLREEIDQLKQQNQELKSRLENLEAKAK